MIKKRKHIIQVLFIFSVFFSCSDNKQHTENEIETETISINELQVSKDQFESARMKLGTVEKYKFTESVSTNGKIDVPPANKALVSAKAPGFVKKSSLLVGDFVKKGALLATIENPDFIKLQQNYLEIFQQLTFLKSEYERQAQLFNEKITSKKEYLRAESNYKSSLAVCNGLKQQLQLLNINTKNVENGIISSQIPIYAPISGNIAKVHTNIGQFMSAEDPLFEIINSEHKHLELVIFEKDVFKIKKGQKIGFKIPEDSTNEYFGEVHLIGQTIDEKDRTVIVHGHLNEDTMPFLVGMYVEATIIIEAFNAIAIPSTAILEENNKHFVYMLLNKNEEALNFKKVEVKVGKIDETHAEISAENIDFQNKEFLIKGAFSSVD